MGHTLNAKNDYLHRMARVQVPKSSLTEPLGVQESIIQYLHKVKQIRFLVLAFSSCYKTHLWLKHILRELHVLLK